MPPSADYIARGISDYLTAETGATIIFESAIVPKWKDSRISFKNVFISRRPRSAPPPPRLKDSESFAAGGYDISGHPGYHRVGEDEDETPSSGAVDEDTNYTMFDFNVDSIDVTLSLWRWLDGKGLIQDAVIKGVRGILGTTRSLFLAGLQCLPMSPQTGGLCIGTPTTLLTPQRSGTLRARATLSSSRSSSRMCW